jgi:hypothetical protein
VRKKNFELKVAAEFKIQRSPTASMSKKRTSEMSKNLEKTSYMNNVVCVHPNLYDIEHLSADVLVIVPVSLCVLHIWPLYFRYAVIMKKG